jgi:lauroyl/myristoyl acyltransferase
MLKKEKRPVRTALLIYFVFVWLLASWPLSFLPLILGGCAYYAVELFEQRFRVLRSA